MIFFKFSVQLLLWLISLVSQLRPNAAFNYCNNRSHVCEVSHMKHFICHIDTELRPMHNKAQYVATIPDTMTMRNLILEYHNKFRNIIASGELRTYSNQSYPQASRMRELIWDVELAYMARLHAATVSFKHTMCRSVLRFPIVGENLSLIFSSTKRRKIKELLDLSLLAMFNEYRYAWDPEELTNNFHGLVYPKVGHFTLMVNDRVSRVGCAYVIARHCDNGSGFCHYMTCHYDFNNMANSYVYKSGKPTSQCSIWSESTSQKYEHLCTNCGKIFSPDHGDDIDRMRAEHEDSL